MKKEFKAKFGEDAPQGDDLHHLIPVNVWKEDPIVKALEKKGEEEPRPLAGVDDGNGLISVPSNSNAMEDTHQNLEHKGGRVKIAHPSSHTEWDKHVKQLSKEEIKKLLKNGQYEKLEDVPIEKLEKGINNIREQLRKDLQNTAKQLEKGNYNNLPSWIDPKYQLKPDPKKTPPSQTKKYPRLVQEKPTNNDINEFRKTLVALKAKVGQGAQKHALYNNRTNLNADERQFRTLGYSAILAVKDNDYAYGYPFVFQRKDTEIGIYRRGDYTQVAKIDLREGVISVDKQFNSVEDNWLAEQQKVVLAQAKETQKTMIQKSRGFEIG
jgi:predicted house-cleaning noncanonical NTP pyrophosphatase (MazG superfamily)